MVGFFYAFCFLLVIVANYFDNPIMTEIHAVKWLKEAGVDEIAGEEPQNFFDIKDTLKVNEDSLSREKEYLYFGYYVSNKLKYKCSPIFIHL